MNKIRLSEDILSSTVFNKPECFHLFVTMLSKCDMGGIGCIDIETYCYITSINDKEVIKAADLINKELFASFYIEEKFLHYHIRNAADFCIFPKVKGEKGDVSLIVKEVIQYLNERTGRDFQPDSIETVKLIEGRLKERFRKKQVNFDMFKAVIDQKIKDWKGKDTEKYIRPETLFARANFHKYLDEYVLEYNKPKKEGGSGTVVGKAKI